MRLSQAGIELESSLKFPGGRVEAAAPIECYTKPKARHRIRRLLLHIKARGFDCKSQPCTQAGHGNHEKSAQASRRDISDFYCRRGATLSRPLKKALEPTIRILAHEGARCSAGL